MSLNSINQPPELAGIGSRALAFGAATATVAGVQEITFAGTSAQAAYPLNCVEAYLCATQACYVSMGDDPVAVAGASFQLPANVPFLVRCNPVDLIAAIQVSAGGVLTVTAVS